MNTIDFSFWDTISIIIYLALLLYFGFRSWKKAQDENTEDYLLANRTLSLPAFIATLVTTWYGGILGVGEFTYLYGISSWVVFGLPYYFFAFLFAFFLSGKIRSSGQTTIPDIFYTCHGKNAGTVASVFLLFMTSPAPYILMAALLVQLLFNINFIISLIFVTLTSTVYVYYGGFRSIIRTDKLQFILMFGCFIILLIFAIIETGGPVFLIDNLDHTYLTWHGGNSADYIIVWFFLASWTFIDPGFHQRCASVKNASIAKKGIFISVAFWFVFDMLTLSTGLYAVISLPDINAVLAFPLLADQILPTFIKGLFFAGLFAIIMSTIDSFTFLSAMTFGRDIVARVNFVKNQKKIKNFTQIGLILTAIISVVLCILFPSVIKLWYIIGSLCIPPLFLPLLSGYYEHIRLNKKQTLWVMIISFFVSFVLFLFKQLELFREQLNVEPFFPGFILSILLYIYFLIRNKKSAMKAP